MLKRIAEKQPDLPVAHSMLVGEYWLSGREDDARREAAEVLRIDPAFSIERSFSNLPFKDQAPLRRGKEALRKAGLK